MSKTGFVAAMDAAQTGDRAARDRLFVILYDELHGMARRALRRNVAMTLGPTTLLHETFLNIAEREAVSFADRPRFMMYASRAMRGLVIDYARMRRAYKRGGQIEITSLPTDSEEPAEETSELEDVNAALDWLAQVDERLAECVELKFFCGFSFIEIAQLRVVSERTVQRDWNKARMLLRRFMKNAVATEESLT
jgi:RNA polymerase sigma factor (TIGR02999 family)